MCKFARFFAAIIFISMLGACGNTQELMTCRQNLSDARAQLKNDSAQEEAEIAYENRAVSFAEVCQAVVQTCPATMMRAGEKAARAGFSGSDLWFYLFAAAKTILFAVAATVVWLVGAFIVLPSGKKIKATRREIDELHKVRAAAELSKSEADRRVELAERAEQNNSAAQQQLAKIRSEIKSEQAALDKLREKKAAEDEAQRRAADEAGAALDSSFKKKKPPAPGR